jgi:DNA-directed RNA polymerase specialized sigma24 family protein
MAARFPTTRWSRIIRAGDPDDATVRAALEQLCHDYWFPLYAFVRRHDFAPHDAEDIVQGFFADLLERGDLAGLDQSKGRFRSFLRAACEHYLANRRDHDRAVRIAVHRLRSRYRELLREEVGRTTDDRAAIDEEIADRMTALTGC